MEEYYKVKSTDLVSIADEIRTKRGISNSLIFPDEYVGEIRNIVTRIPRLPNEYQEVIYLESNGTEYINLPNIGAPITEFVAEFDLAWRNLGTAQQAFGFNGTINTFEFFFVNDNTVGTWEYGLGTGTKASVTPNVWHRYKIEASVTNNVRSITIDGTKTVNGGFVSVNAFTSLQLFGYRNGNYPFSGFLKEGIYIANEHQYHLIPCYRKSDNVPGLYDLIGKAFYINSGTGSFSCGPII